MTNLYAYANFNCIQFYEFWWCLHCLCIHCVSSPHPFKISVIRKSFLFPSVTPNPASGSHWSDLYYYILQVLSVLKLHVKGTILFDFSYLQLLWDSPTWLHVAKVCPFLLLTIKYYPWRRAWPPTPVFLPREFHGQRSLVGYSP